MRKSYRVKSKKDFSILFSRGKSFANKKFVIYKLDKEQKHFRIGLSVGKKLGNAVVRNRIKRRLRHILLRNTESLSKMCDFVIIARQGVEELSFRELEQNLLHVLKLSKTQGKGLTSETKN